MGWDSRAIAMLLCVACVAPACSAKRPVLYPNEVLEEVGREVSQTEVEECIQLAKESGADSSDAAEVAGSTAAGGAVGGATGAAAGAILGRVGPAAAAGAAVGGIAGLFRGLFRSREPNPVFRAFVERCLRDRGYEPIGWR